MKRILPKHPAIDISISCRDGEGVGNECLDVRLDDDNTMTFCVGDSGCCGSILEQFRSTMGTPVEIMDALNEVAIDNNLDKKPYAMFIGQLNLSNGRFVFCNAGHAFPKLSLSVNHKLSPEYNPFCNSQLANCQPLGMESGTCYTERAIILPMGATLSFITSEISGNEDGSCLEITWKARLESLHSWLLAQGLVDNINELALEEALVNILKYSSATAVSVISLNSISFQFIDNGKAFDPTTAISQSDGVGLELIRGIGSPVYKRQGDLNVLTLTFGEE